MEEEKAADIVKRHTLDLVIDARPMPTTREELKAFVNELVRQELERLDERIDKRIDAALKRSVLALRPTIRGMEFK